MLEISDCPSVFSFASPKEKTGKRKRVRRDSDFPPDLLEPARKPLRVFWTFPAKIETAQKFQHCSYRRCRGRCRSQPFATKERYGCGSAACRYTSARTECTVFSGIFGEFATFFGPTESSAPTATLALPCRGGRLCPPAARTKRVPALFSPLSFLLREKRQGRRRHDRYLSSDTPAPDRAPSAHTGSCSLHCVRPAGPHSMGPDTAHGCGRRLRGGRSRC